MEFLENKEKLHKKRDPTIPTSSKNKTFQGEQKKIAWAIFSNQSQLCTKGWKEPIFHWTLHNKSNIAQFIGQLTCLVFLLEKNILLTCYFLTTTSIIAYTRQCSEDFMHPSNMHKNKDQCK